MPAPLNRNESVTWPAHYAWDGGTLRYRFQSGFRTLKTDPDKDQVLEYDSSRFAGVVSRYNVHPVYKSLTSPTGPGSGSPYWKDWNGGNPGFASSVRNKCYAKFKEKALGDTAQIGTFIAEGREAYGMIAKRAIGLHRAYKSLRQGDFRRFLRDLSVNPKKRHRNKTHAAVREVSGLWLEYWFGWSPSVNDMFTAVEVLNASLAEERLSAASGRSYPQAERLNIGPSFSNNRSSQFTSVRIIWKTGATLRVNSPNLLLSSRLGLIDPLQIAWEVVPFSFVADWFTKFGNVLSARTDFLGLSLLKPYRTCLCSGPFQVVTFDKRAPGYGGTIDYHPVRMSRKKGLISPVVLWPVPTNFGQSHTRAATAVSLLSQILLAKK